MHLYRTHNCGQLRKVDAGSTARLSGWVHRKRDHGNLVFVDLRDHYGMTQCVIDIASPVFKTLETARAESVITVTGKVVERSADTVNTRLPTRRGRAAGHRGLDPVGRRHPADDGRGRAGVPRGYAPALSLPRSAPRKAACQYAAAQQCHRLAAPPHDRSGLRRISDTDSDRLLARGCARLSGGVARPSRQILRPAAGAAAIQAALDGGRLRPLFPDRPPASATRMAVPTAAPANSISSISR